MVQKHGVKQSVNGGAEQKTYKMVRVMVRNMVRNRVQNIILIHDEEPSGERVLN